MSPAAGFFPFHLVFILLNVNFMTAAHYQGINRKKERMRIMETTRIFREILRFSADTNNDHDAHEAHPQKGRKAV